MTARFVSRFGAPVDNAYLDHEGAKVLAHLNRPLRHHRSGRGSLWERVAEGKTR